MPKVVVVLPSTTFRASDFFEAAASLDVDLVVASEKRPVMDMGDGYVEIDCADPSAAAESIAKLGDEVPIDGVVAADDAGVMVAAHLSQMLGLAGNSPDAAILTRNKLLMRKALQAAEVDQPRFAALNTGANGNELSEEVGLPLVIKPLDRAASQGVIRVDREEDVAATVSRIRALTGEGATLLMESYAPGAEIAIEGLVNDGELTVLAVFDKPDTSEGPYFPETIFVTPSRMEEETLEIASRTAQRAVTALGLTQGPVHIELRCQDQRARVIEVAARSIGGLCSRSLNFGLTGTTLESLILRNALDLGRTHLKREQTASGVLMIPTPVSGTLASVNGIDEARSIDAVTGVDITVGPGVEIVAPPDGDRYVGFVYASAATPEVVEAALRKAMETIEIELES